MKTSPMSIMMIYDTVLLHTSLSRQMMSIGPR